MVRDGSGVAVEWRWIESQQFEEWGGKSVRLKFQGARLQLATPDFTGDAHHPATLSLGTSACL